MARLAPGRGGSDIHAAGTLDEGVAQMQRGEVGPLRRGVDALRLARAGRRPGRRPPIPAHRVWGQRSRLRGLVDAGVFSLIEVLARPPSSTRLARVAADVVPRLLSGAMMCARASPSRRRQRPGVACGAGPWPTATAGSHAQKCGTKAWSDSDRCVLLTRTGTPDSRTRHHGVLVDMDTPGITVAPLEMINGVHEFAEVSSTTSWCRRTDPGESTAVGRRHEHPPLRAVDRLLAADGAPVSPARRAGGRRARRRSGARVIGDAYLALHTLRARSRITQHRLAGGATLGAETSIDKVLVASAEQATFDAVRTLLPGVVELDDTPDGVTWRSEYIFSRAATIYGGTSEVQRNIIARRLLDAR